jgi:hypothetical protein
MLANFSDERGGTGTLRGQPTKKRRAHREGKRDVLLLWFERRRALDNPEQPQDEDEDQ